MWDYLEPQTSPKTAAKVMDTEVDYNPDHQCSHSAIFHGESDRDGSVICVIQVRGLGVIALRGKDDEHGVSILTKAEIGYSEKL